MQVYNRRALAKLAIISYTKSRHGGGALIRTYPAMGNQSYYQLKNKLKHCEVSIPWNY